MSTVLQLCFIKQEQLTPGEYCNAFTHISRYAKGWHYLKPVKRIYADRFRHFLRDSRKFARFSGLPVAVIDE
jgi:hypothetical protein